MSSPREAQLPLLLSISEGLSRGADEMLRVSPQGDAIHPPSCSLAIRESVEEIKWLRAEVERLTEWQSINHSEQHRLGWSMTEFCEGKRDHLHEMWERPPSLDYGIAHIEAEIKRLRAHNARLRAHKARLRAQVDEYFREPATHPVEREE